MQNATRQAVARKRRPVRCRNCGHVTTPVSGFCSNCLERLPLGRRVPLVPVVALLALVALGFGVVAGPLTRPIALGPGNPPGQSTPTRTVAGSQATAAERSPTLAPTSSLAQTMTPTTSAVASAGATLPSGSPGTAGPSPSSPPDTTVASPSAPGASGRLPSTSTQTRTGTGAHRYW
jgi:hypothetical protein